MAEFKIIQFDGSGTLTVDLRLADDLFSARFHATRPDMIWPAFSHLHRADELWRSTCFELFIREPGARRYLEINVSPGGAWNCYEFEDYRQGMKTSNKLTMKQIRTEDSGLIAQFTCPAIAGLPIWQLGLSAVCERPDGKLEYYGLSHGDRPDFHDVTHHVPVERHHLLECE